MIKERTKKRSNKKISREKDLKILQMSAKNASERALRTSKALGLTVRKIVDNEIIEQSPDGSITVLGKLNAIPLKQKGLKKGSRLCLR